VISGGSAERFGFADGDCVRCVEVEGEDEGDSTAVMLV